MKGIKEKRAEMGVTQVQLAALAGMDPATLNRIEQGKANPNLKTIERLADALEVEVADFFPKAQAPLPLDVGNGGSGAFDRGSVRVWVRYLEESVGYFARRLERQDLGLSGISEISSLTIGLMELCHIFEEDVLAEADADLLNRYEKAGRFLVFDLDDMVIERYDREVRAAKETQIGGDALDETAAISSIEEWKSTRLKGREKLRLGA